MNIAKKEITEYQELYKTHFGKDIDHQTAYEQLQKLVSLVEITSRPITEEQLIEHARQREMKNDAKELAELLYDMYKEKKAKGL